MYLPAKGLVFSFGCILFLFSPTNAEHRYYWRNYMGYVPEDAFQGAENLYVAQAPTNGLLPATFYPKTQEAVTEISTRRATYKKGIQLLCAADHKNFVWEFVNINSVTGDGLKNLVVGGLEVDTVLYIGKIFHQGEWKIGKVFPAASGLRGLRIWTRNGDLYVAADFQVLKYIDNTAQIFDVRSSK